jgi:DNA polymerase II small subunit/DNA polymerase delta subunit B
MNEEEVVKLFLKNGFQISKNALPLILENPEQILSELKKIKPRPFIISEQHVKNIQKPVKIKPAEIKIIKEYKQEQKPLSVKDYVDHFLSRYEELKKIISKKMETERLISINKIATQTMMCSIIGIVREKNKSNILVEDPTGEVYVFFDDSLKEKLDEISLDDVIGVTIKKIKDKYYAKTLTFPDISSKREISKAENDMILAVVSTPPNIDDIKYKNLISILSSTENLSSVIFFDETTNEKITNDLSKFSIITPKTNPSLIQIDNIKILLLPRSFFETLTFDSHTSDTITQIMKRRHLSPPFIPNSLIEHDDYILTEIPDLVISNLNETINKNYKGTTILSNSDPHKIFLINLKTREVVEKTI